MARYRTQHVATAPSGWRVRSKRAGGHVLRIAFPPGRRKKGAGRVVEVLHPKRENPGCAVERKNPEQLLIFGLNNPSKFKTRRSGQQKNAGGGFGNHKPGCPCAFCQRAAKLQSGELKPPKLPNRSRRRKNKLGDARAYRGYLIKETLHGYAISKGGAHIAFAKSEAAARKEIDGLTQNPKKKRKRRNPDDTGQAVQLFQAFHGKDPQGIIEAQEPDLIRETYTVLGRLDYLKLRSPLGEMYQIDFEIDGVKLAMSPDGKQLYCIGGNQNLATVLDADSLQKDIIDLGECVEVQYLARKAHSNFEPVNWYHKFGEKSGDRPEMIYDKLRKRVYFAGGNYYVQNTTEISPGIEN